MKLFGRDGDGEHRERLFAWVKLTIGAVIACGFLTMALVHYNRSLDMMHREAETLSVLTSERICNRVTQVLDNPINTAVAMASSQLLKDILEQEQPGVADEAYTRAIYDYLKGYRDSYGYTSVFLISERSGRYYNSTVGFDRYLNENGADDSWYYKSIAKIGRYNLDIGYDYSQHAGRRVNLFVDTKVYSSRDDRKLLGLLGVAVHMEELETIFDSYGSNNNLQAYLIDSTGVIELSSDKNQLNNSNFFADPNYAEYEKAILSNHTRETRSRWYNKDGRRGLLTAMYIPMLQWYLVVDHNTRPLETAIWQQLFWGAVGIVFIVGIVLVLVSHIIKHYNEQIFEESEKNFRLSQIQKEASKMYEGVYEIDLTHDAILSDSGFQYVTEAGMSAGVTYDEAIKSVFRTRTKKEYRKGYADKFLRKNLLRAFDEGKDHVSYEFQSTRDGGKTYRWTRVTARLFRWTADNSVHMLMYDQNINNEKQREAAMESGMRHDALSGLLNKVATQELGQELLSQAKGDPCAFFIIDIDNFKQVNDTYGHAVGDDVITDFAQRIQQIFRHGDVVGRIGGDEFAVVLRADQADNWLRDKARHLSEILHYDFYAEPEVSPIPITASVGVAVSPQNGTSFDELYRSADVALYHTKHHGKNGYTVHGPELTHS